MDREARKLYYNRCDPSESLGPEDDRNLDVDALGVRGAPWAEGLATRIELSDRPLYELFTGLPGTGVTTELRRLEGRLHKTDKPWLTVRIDAGEIFDLTSTVHPVDLLLGILDRVTEAVRAIDKDDPEGITPDPWMRRFRAWVASDETNRPGAPSLGASELRADPALRERVRKHVATKMTWFVTEIHEELVLLLDRARRLGREGLVVMIDSFQQLRGMTANARDVLESAERLFRDGTSILQLPVHAIYTVPPALIAGRLRDPVELLPCIRIRDRSGARSDAGHEAAREIIRRRIPDEPLAEILGRATFSERVEQIIAWSGGHPGDLMRILRRLVASGESTLSPSTLRRILAEGGETYIAGLPAGAYSLLARVAAEKPSLPAADGQPEVAEAVLASGAVLPYRNGDRWFDVHPAVLALPGVRGSVEQLAVA